MQSQGDTSGQSETSASEWDDEDVRQLIRLVSNSPRKPLLFTRLFLLQARVTQGDPMTKEDYMSSLKLVFKFRTMAEYQDKFETYRGEGDACLRRAPR